MSGKTPKMWYSVTEMADLTGYSRQNILLLIHEKSIKARKFGGGAGTWHIHAEEVAKFTGAKP